MRPPSSRSKKRSVRYHEYELHEENTVAASDDVTLDQQHQQQSTCRGAAAVSKPKRKRGRPRKQQLQAAESDDEQESDAAAAAAADDDGQDDQDSLEHFHDGAWTEAEARQLAEMGKDLTKGSSNGRYRIYQRAYEAFCEKMGCNPQVTSTKDIPKLARFYKLFCTGGEAGGKISKRKSKDGQLTPQAAMTVHAALRQLVDTYCLKARTGSISLLEDLHYRILYKTYTKGRGLKRLHNTHMTFKSDDHLNLMAELMAQGDAESIITRLMFALGVSTVSRGDEIRDLRWSQLNWKSSAAIGE
ncbi:hypothetical protein OEZ85_000123 [Tetradesmus obliquus]|uniref:Uncharacterized protein n=1 Tax=Tetradesmus obliquus TaxID=3088 RepID=A0ABY8UQF2_TETOB|nr:hypothetical protein OEZ85_000123 [Tetradesmus obliquus]